MKRSMDPAPSDEQELDTENDFMREVGSLDRPRRTPRSIQRPSPPKNKGKGKEMRSDVQILEPLTDEEEEVLQNLNAQQVNHLRERFRPEIREESRPGHRDEFYTEMADDIQASFDLRLAAERQKWEQERRQEGRQDREVADRMANKAIDDLKEKLAKRDRDVRISFSKGKEEGEESAVAKYAARWNDMDEQLVRDKKQLQIKVQELDRERERLEGLARDRTNVLGAEAAARAEEIATQAQEIERWKREAAAYVEQVQKESLTKNEEIKRREAEVESLRQQLDDQNTRYQDQLDSEVRSQQEVMQANIEGYDVNRPTERMSSLHIDPETVAQSQGPANLTTEPAGSTPRLSDPPDRRVQRQLSRLQSKSRQLEQNLARQMASNKALKDSLAECHARHDIQPPVDDCPARLQSLQALLEQQHARQLKEQAERMAEGFKRDAEAIQATKDAEVAEATAQASQKIARLKGVIAHLEEREMERWRDKAWFFPKTKELEASLAQKAKECESLTVETRRLAASEKSARQEVQSLKEERAEMVEARKVAAMEVGETELRLLRKSNQALEAEKYKATAIARSTRAELTTARAQFARVSARLAECEAAIKEKGEEMAEQEGLVDGRLKAFTEWEEDRRVAVVVEKEGGEREMDAPIGVLEEAIEGFLRPQFPRWMEFVFWLLMLLFLLWGLGSRVEEMMLGAGEDPSPLWDDVLLDLSRGMYSG